MTSRSSAPRRETFYLTVCGETGQVACMDCIEGQCAGTATEYESPFTRCVECGGDDVYASEAGDICHRETCSEFVP